MKRFLLILLFALLVVGCGSDAPETAVEPTAEQVEVAANDNDEEEVDESASEQTEEDTAVEEEMEEPTAVPEEEPTEEPTEEPVEEPTAEPEEETPVEAEQIVLGDPTQVRDSDWVKGSENGRVVIIEYGDFQ